MTFHGIGFGYDSTYYSAVQKRLNDLGANPPLVVDGKWGDKSKKACVTFQKAHGLVPDGVPRTKTLEALGYLHQHHLLNKMLPQRAAIAIHLPMLSERIEARNWV